MMNDENRRWYVRCLGCLSVSAIDAPYLPPGMKCAICEERIEIMGYVKKAMLKVGEEVRSVCDDRCTNAQGPLCDCPCAGANHGSRRVVVVEVFNNIPKIRPVDAEKALRISDEFSKKMEEVQNALNDSEGAKLGHKKAEGFVLSVAESTIRWKYNMMKGDFRRAAMLKVHKKRMDKLNEILKEISG